MQITHIPFSKTGYFSKTMIDYLNQEESIRSFYNNFPDIDGFAKQIDEKKNTFSVHPRKVLTEVLKDQYVKFQTSEATFNNIESLLNNSTFTVTTGHQLNLFTGPLYFLYKIISTINLCEELSSKFPENNFVPIYWMATEDHDFDEINFFNFKGTKVVWNSNESGAVGRYSTDGLEEIYEEFAKHLGSSKSADYIKYLFKKGYTEHTNLSEATRYVANELFGKFGLVILDADNNRLKQLFTPFVKNELLNQISFLKVSETINEFQNNYKVQVNPREINLFYLTDTNRERIVIEDNLYKVNNTQLAWTKEEVLKQLEDFPERFSPNVIMRPLFQEVILPNLAYVGGGGELAYWLELKKYFDTEKVPFPILFLRNSVLVISKKQSKKLNNLSISREEIFLNQNDLLAKKVQENSDIKFSFQDAEEILNQQFLELRRVAEKTDASFIGAVDAQYKKQIKGLQNLQKRLLKAKKRNHSDLVERIIKIQNQLFPNQSLEERYRNFSELYLEFGEHFIPTLKKSLKPLQLEFTILEI